MEFAKKHYGCPEKVMRDALARIEKKSDTTTAKWGNKTFDNIDSCIRYISNMGVKFYNDPGGGETYWELPIEDEFVMNTIKGCFDEAVNNKVLVNVVFIGKNIKDISKDWYNVIDVELADGSLEPFEGTFYIEFSYVKGMSSEKRSVATELQPTIAKWYKATRLIAIIGLLSVLVYIGIRIILNTSDTTKALYKNPTFKIKLPSYIEKCNLNSYDIVMGDGLKIKSAKTATENGQIVINVELEGAQTEYATNAQYVGAVIDINVDLTTKTLTPTNTNKITMEYKNNNEMSENNNGTVEEKVNFIAPEGIVTANGISNYAQGKEILTIADEGATGIIATNSAKRTITITGKIINNYNSTIKDIVILGRIPAKGNTNIDTNVDLGSTFDTSLKTAIQLQNIETSDYTVYYSIKANANKDLTDTSNEWTTTFNVNAKSYMVVYGKDLNETKMIEFAYDVELPENLSYNNSIYEMYKIYYTNMSSIGNIQESKTSPIIELTTGKGTELSVQLSSDVETVREGQTVRMKAIVKNSGELTAKNVKINIPLPKYATFTNLIEGNYFEKDDSTNKVIALGTIAKNEEKEVLYYLKFNNYADVFNGEEITDEEKSEYLKFPKAIKKLEEEKKIKKEFNLLLRKNKGTNQLFEQIYDFYYYGRYAEDSLRARIILSYMRDYLDRRGKIVTSKEEIKYLLLLFQNLYKNEKIELEGIRQMVDLMEVA